MTSLIRNDSKQLCDVRSGPRSPVWGAEPLRAVFVLVSTLLCVGVGPDPARAEPQADLRSSNDLDGLHLGVGPIGSATRMDGAWDGAFGGEVVVAWVRERRVLTAWGGSAGAVRFAKVDRGRAWLDALAATNRVVPGLNLGMSLGVVAELDAVRPARPGWQATAWAYFGVMPYVRVGQIRDSGTFIDIGLKLVLPTLRWQR